VLQEFVEAFPKADPGRIRYPTGKDLDRVIEGFERIAGLPSCCGAIDGTKIRIMASGIHKADYYDHGGSHSYNVQVIVDSKGRVLSAFCGSPGSLHDARVFRNSGFHKNLLARKVLNGPSISVGGVDVPQYLVGDAG
jgi:hypothetical protein